MIIQAIQDFHNQVPLVAGKETWVRAFVSSDQQLAVRGTLLVRNPTRRKKQFVQSVNEVLIKPEQNSDSTDKANNLGATLNFIVPASLSDSGVIEVSMNSFSVAAMTGRIACIGCLGIRESLPLVQVPPLRVRIFGFEYAAQLPDGTPINYKPRESDYARLEDWLRRAYPVPSIVASRELIMATKAPPLLTCRAVNAQLQGIRRIEMEDPRADARTHYYGLVYDGGTPEYFMRGCAAGIPSNPDASTVASGPTGKPTGAWANWDLDGSYGDWYAGHELGHTFGRYHVGGCSGLPDDISSAPYPLGYPRPEGRVGAGEEGFVGLDVGDSSPRVLPGDLWRDLMTYCDMQWISPYTYMAVLQRLNEENHTSAGNNATYAGSAPDLPDDVLAGPTLPTQPTVPPRVQNLFFFISGTFNLTRQTGEIISLVPIIPDSSTVQGTAPGGPLITVQLKTADGSLKKEVAAELRFDSDVGAAGQPRDSTGVFKAVFVADKDVDLIEVHMQGVPKPIATQRRPAKEPTVISKTQLTAGSPEHGPTTLMLAAPGTQNQRATYTVVAIYKDPPPGTPPTRVLKNDDNPELILPADVFGNQDHVQLKITVSNGLESSVQVLDVKRPR